jgi:hypothetical protein
MAACLAVNVFANSSCRTVLAEEGDLTAKRLLQSAVNLD